MPLLKINRFLTMRSNYTLNWMKSHIHNTHTFAIFDLVNVCVYLSQFEHEFFPLVYVITKEHFNAHWTLNLEEEEINLRCSCLLSMLMLSKLMISEASSMHKHNTAGCCSSSTWTTERKKSMVTAHELVTATVFKDPKKEMNRNQEQKPPKKNMSMTPISKTNIREEEQQKSPSTKHNNVEISLV